MDGIGMKRLLIRLSAASGLVVAVLVAIAAAKGLGWGKRPAAAASNQPATTVAAKPTSKADGPAAASEAPSTPSEVPLKDPFQPAPSAAPARYEPQDYYQDATQATPPAVTSTADSTADLMESAADAMVAVEDAAGTEQNGEATYQAEENAAQFAAQPDAFAATASPGASQESTEQPPDEVTSESTGDGYTDDYADRSNPATEQSTVESPQDWPQEEITPPAEEPKAAPDRFASQEVTEPATAAAPSQAKRDSEGANDYLREQFPAAQQTDGAVASPPYDVPATTVRTPVRGAAEGAGVPGDPKLESEQGAALVIHKTGPPEVQLGLETVYEIRVQNVGDAPAHGVEVHDVAPRGADLIATQPQVAPGEKGELVWALGTLAPGEETTVEMRVIPRTEGEIGSVARVVFCAEAAARTLVTKPVLELSVEAPKSVLAGERVQLFVRVTNTGTGVATGVVLEEVVPAGFEHPAGATLEYRVGTLKPRDSRELPLTLSAKNPTDSMNVVTARAEGDITVEQRTPLSIVAPALEVEMQGPRRRFLDRDATYTVAIKNPGTAPAHEIELVTFLAEGMEFVAADSAGQYDPQTRAVYWLLDELPPNEMGSVTVTARPTKPGEHVLRVEGRAQRGLEAIEEQPILVEGLAAVEFQVIDLADPVEIGGEAAYEIVVKNGGTKESSEIELVAMLPVEMQLVTAEGPTRFKAAGQKIMFEPLKALAPGESVSYQLTAKTVDAGDARLQVKLITAEMQSPVTKEENTKVFGDE